MKNIKIKNIIFGIIIVVAVIVRVMMWPNGIQEVNCDEVMTAINAKSIADTGKDIYGTSYPVYFEAWGYTGQSVMLGYIIAIFIKIFGASIYVVRLPMLIISIISLFVMYDLCKRIFQNTNIALIILAILSICPWHIMQSKWALDCNLFPHFMLISIWLLYIGINENRKYIYISMIMFALTMYTYGLAIYVVPLFLILMAIYLLVNKQVEIKEILLCVLIYLLFSMPIILMYIVNLFKLNDIHIGNITIQYFDNSVRTQDMLVFSNNFLDTLIRNIKKTLQIVLIQYDGLIWNSIPEFGTIYFISIFFAGIGLTELIINRNKELNISKLGSYIIKIWLVLSLLLGMLVNDININRLNIIWYPIIMLTGYGTYNICIGFTKYRKMYAISVILVYFAMFTSFNYEYYKNYIEKIETSFCWSNGLNRAMEHAIKLDRKNIKIDENVLSNGACPIYIRYALEFNNSNKNYSYTNIEEIEDNSIYIILKQNMTEDLEKNINIRVF